MVWHCIEKQPIGGQKSDFFRAVDIWLDKAHVINRRLCDSSLEWECVLNVDVESDMSVHLDEIVSRCINDDDNLNDTLNKLTFELESWGRRKISTNTREIEIQLRKQLPKQPDKYDPILMLVIINKSIGFVDTIPIQTRKSLNYLAPPYRHKLSFDLFLDGTKNQMSLWVYDSQLSKTELLNKPAICWMKVVLFNRLKKWTETELIQPSIPSHRLVAADKYNLLYLTLKSKYGQNLVKKWPEKTDPSKFVYEDVAIATYLLLLWQNEREVKNLTTKQSFVDLGCGNGLLVYLLTKEGHPGFGLDVRKRKIWDLYSSDVKLMESPVIPSPETVYPNCDWLIGNHSDELTPWIPVMAARSSYNTRFFLLPCCSHDFDRKFQRSGSSQSQYRSYLDYIEQVSKTCGFVVEIDKLRIPSTKRVCLVGMNRNYDKKDTNLVDDNLMQFIEQRCSLGRANNETKENFKWDDTVSVRSAVEPVLNCTRLDKNLIREILEIVTSRLLQYKFDVVTKDEDEQIKYWNSGGKLSLSDLAEIVGKEKLFKLKSQCGGLQTLLRNHSNIFKVLDGLVTLRNYTESFSNSSRAKPKKTQLHPVVRKPCWFYYNHPNGCVLNSRQCKFLHEIKTT